jgi:hypothetical protein
MMLYYRIFGELIGIWKGRGGGMREKAKASSFRRDDIQRSSTLPRPRPRPRPAETTTCLLGALVTHPNQLTESSKVRTDAQRVYMCTRVRGLPLTPLLLRLWVGGDMQILPEENLLDKWCDA